MTVEEGDLDRWRELSNFASCSSSESEEAEVDNVGRITAEGGTYRHTSSSNGLDISIQHEPEKGLSFQIWPSSLSLISFAEEADRQHPGHWKDRGVLELGCGCGLVGLVLAALGANVALTDLPKNMDLLQRNIKLNREAVEASGGSAIAFPLTWGETETTSLPSIWQNPDLVVAADVIYHRELFAPLLDALKSLARKPSTTIILAHVRRWKSDKAFFARARKLFVVEDITSQAGLAASTDAGQASHTKGALRIYQLTRIST